MLGKRRGIQKVSFWLIIILALILLSFGVRLGVLFSRGIMLPQETWTSIKAATSEAWTYILGSFDSAYADNPTSFCFAIVVMLLIGIALWYLFYKHLPHKRKSFDIDDLPILEKFQLLLYICMLAIGITLGMEDSIGAKILSLELGVLTVTAAVWLVKVLQDVYVNPNSTDFAYFEQHKKSVLIKTTLLGIALVGLPLWIPDFWGFRIPQILQGQDLFGYYTAILSLTFISISVMSVLSDRTVVIYWENIAEGKLIKPVFGSFAAYTYYSIGSAIAAGICVVLNNSTAFIVFCTITITTIILLTYTMVDVYYDRESKKVQRKNELRMDEADYRWICESTDFFEKMQEPTAEELSRWSSEADVPQWLRDFRNKPWVLKLKETKWFCELLDINNKKEQPKERIDPCWLCKAKAFLDKKQMLSDATESSWIPRNKAKNTFDKMSKAAQKKYILNTYQDKQVGRKRYIDKMLLLCQNIHRANDEHDLTYLQEVHELYRKNISLFRHLEGKRVAHVLFSECEAQNWPLVMSSLQAHIANMTENQARDADPFIGNYWVAGKHWNQDESLWAALTTSEYLRDWLSTTSNDMMDVRELQEFLLLIIQRWILLYNDMVTHYNFANKTDACDYLQTVGNNAICIRTESGKTPDKKQVTKVFEAANIELLESSFVARLLRVLYIMLDNSKKIQERIPDHFSNFPLPQLFSPHMINLDFDENEIEFWNRYFSNK